MAKKKYLEKYGVVRRKGRSIYKRSNEETQELYQSPGLTKVVKAQQVPSMGHVLRMEEPRTPRKVLDSQLGVTKRRGRLVKKWRPEVEGDLRMVDSIWKKSGK